MRSVGFYFDDDGKLTGMCYSFSDDSGVTSRSACDSAYEKLTDGLKRKYGNPLGNTGGSIHLISGPAFERFGLWLALTALIDTWTSDYYDYDEWIVDTDDGHVKIDIVSYYYRNSDYDYSYYVDLSYHFYTDQDLQDKIDEKRQERDAVDNDL